MAHRPKSAHPPTSKVVALRQVCATKRALEPLLFHEVTLTTGLTPTEDRLESEAPGVFDARGLYCGFYRRPTRGIRTISCGVVGQLDDLALAHEQLSSAEYWLAAGAGHVLAAPWRKVQHTIQADGVCGPEANGGAQVLMSSDPS